MEIEMLYLILGIVIGLTAVGIIGIVNMRKQISSAEEDIKTVWNGIDSLNTDLGKEIDNIHRILNDELHLKNIEIHREIDSRIDRLENRLTKMFNDGCKPVQDNK